MNNRSKMMLDEHDSFHNVRSDDFFFNFNTEMLNSGFGNFIIIIIKNESTDYSQDFSDFFLIKIFTAQAKSAKCKRVKENLIKMSLNVVRIS